MVAHFQIKNSSIISKIVEIMREQAKEGNGKFLRRIDETIRWAELRNLIVNRIPILNSGIFEHHDVLQLFKCLIIGNIYNLSDYQIPLEITDRKSYQNFIEMLSNQNVPGVNIISAFKMLLEKYDLYDELFDKFYEQLLDSKFKIMEGSENALKNDSGETHENSNLVDFNKIAVKNDAKVDDKVNEIEDRIKKLYEKKTPSTFGNSASDASNEDLKNKLMDVENQIKIMYKEKKEEQISEKELNNQANEKKMQDTKELLERLISIDERIKNISSIADNLESKKDLNNAINENEDLYKKIFSSFYNQQPVPETTVPLKTVEVKKEEVIEEKPVSETVIVESEIPKVDAENTPAGSEPKIEAKKITPHGVLVLTPKAKKEGIFNDANLTEDYELGYRFYELGFKTGFFNIKLDKFDDASRIATAEFFPSTFWTSVKQRSRWIAGICFQNWKSHKWKGNLSTKYFLFRDRKSIFSFFGAFLSNIVILYFIYSIIANLFHFKYVYSLVSHSSVLWYLMIANLLFMISRASHRFIFTYNWYGFKYAFFSFFRLILDTFINFFSIIRSVDVFRKTKKKVVWDATSHY